MNLFAILPVKPFAEGKSRLKHVLSDAARCEFNRHMYEHVLTVAISMLGAAKTIVVSADQSALALARHSDALAVREEKCAGLNRALKIGAQTASAQGGDAVLILPTDLPTMSPGDIVALIDEVRPSPSVVIAPDRLNQGTNALLVSPPNAIEFSFGRSSFTKHWEAARALHIEPIPVRRDGLAFDIDTPDDYRQLEREGWRSIHPVTSN